MRKRTCIATILLIAAASIPSLKSLPWASFWGLDFFNLWAFHHCAALGEAGQPYGIAGAACGDPLGRDLFYPPLLYHFFAWVRLLPSFEVAYAIWATAIGASIALAYRFWSEARGAAALAFLGLTYLQYPTVFAIERGNTDAGPLLLVLAACALWQKRKPGLAGLAMGLAVSFKVYPVFAAAVFMAGAITSLAALVGVAAGALLPVALFPIQSKTYFLEVLPRFAKTRNPPGLANHSVLPRFAEAPIAGYALCATLLGVWVYRAYRSLRVRQAPDGAVAVPYEYDPKLVFAGALAISTYFSGVSEDYNLVTVMPLLFLQLGRALRDPEPRGSEGEAEAVKRDRWLLVLGTAAVFGHRQIFVGTSVYFQLAWLIATALLGSDPRASEHRQEAAA